MPSLLLFALAAWAADDPATAPTTEVAAPAEATAPEAPGELEVDCKVPAEILVDGVKLAQLYYAGVARFDVPVGDHLLRIYVGGEPTDLHLRVDADTRARVLVGRTGISLDDPIESDDDPDAIVHVEFRVVGTVGAQLRLGTERHVVPAGGALEVDIPTGSHRLSVRSEDGTVIWANGQLAVRGSQRVFVQVAEGRLPEVSGHGRFQALGGG